MTGATTDRAPAGPGLVFALLCASVALEALGVGVLFPLLAKIQAAHHLPTYGLGLMSGASFFAALLAGVGVVRLLDGRGAHGMLLAALLLGAAALVWFAHGTDLWQLVAARSVGGVAYGIMGPAALREASVGARGAARGRRLGMLSSAMMLGIVVGPLIGSLLAAGGDLALPFEVVAAGLLVVFVAVLAATTGRPVTAAPAAEPGGPARPGSVRVAMPPWRPVVAVLALAAASQLPNGLYDALWSRLLTDRGASGLLIGLSLTIFGIPFVLLAPFGGKLAERRGPLLATAVSLIVADLVMASYGFVPSPIAITVLGAVEACAQAVAVPGGYAAIARTFPDERAATGQGWASSSGTAAAGLAAVAGAPVYAAFGSGAVFAGGATLSAVLVVAAVRLGRGSIPAGPDFRPVAPAPLAPLGAVTPVPRDTVPEGATRA